MKPQMTHAPAPVAWQKFGAEYCLTGQYGMRPIILSVGKRSKSAPINGITGKATLKLLNDGLLVDFTPDHPDAQFIVKAWNCHDDLLAACKDLNGYLNAVANQLPVGELCSVLEKVKSSAEAIAKAEGQP